MPGYDTRFIIFSAVSLFIWIIVGAICKVETGCAQRDAYSTYNIHVCPENHIIYAHLWLIRLVLIFGLKMQWASQINIALSRTSLNMILLKRFLIVYHGCGLRCVLESKHQADTPRRRLIWGCTLVSCALFRSHYYTMERIDQLNSAIIGSIKR